MSETNKTTKGGKIIISNTVAVLLAAIIVAIASVGVVYIKDSLKPLTGQITKPAEGTLVGDKFYAKGVLDRIPSNTHLWLAVKVDSSIWPKKEIQKNHLSWAEKVEEYGSGHDFFLALVAVDGDDHSRIIAWQENRDKIKDWGPIPNLENPVILDQKRLRAK